jgi:nucleoid DNA-binding protein
MTKTELVAAIAAKANLTKKDASESLNAFIEVVSSELVS